MVMNRLEGAYSVYEIAKKKEAEGDVRRAHKAYETVIRDFMCLSFVECSTVMCVIEWLSKHPFEPAVDSFVKLTEKVYEMPKDKWRLYFQSGNYMPIAFSHLFSALGYSDKARFLSQVAAESTIFSTEFWGEYGRTYRAFIAGDDYVPQFGKTNFLEKYEVVYIDLMVAVMRGESIDATVAEVDRQFIARNADSRMNAADAYMIEGSLSHPVRFDFRKAGLLATIPNTKLQAIT